MVLAWLALMLAPQLQLEWRAPEGCPQLQDVRARVDRSWAADAGGVIAAKGEVVGTGERARPWRLRLRLVAASGTADRELEGRSCDALADAAALMIAMAASPDAEAAAIVVPEPVEPPPPEVVTPPAIAATPSPATSPAATPPREIAREDRGADAITAAPIAPVGARRRLARPAAELAIAGGFDALAVPGVGGTLAGAVGLHWPRLRVRVTVVHAIVRDVGATPSARHRMTAGGLALCGFGNVRRWAIGACGHAEVGRLHAEGRGGSALVDRDLPWVAVGVGPAVQWRFATRWALTGDAGVLVPVRRHRFSVGATQVSAIGPAGVRLLVGLAVRLP